MWKTAAPRSICSKTISGCSSCSRLVVIGVICAALLRGYAQTVAGRLALVLICAGAVGNLIDRIFRNFVVDMIHFTLIDFPVFNVADIFVCVGVALVFLLHDLRAQG